MFFANSSTKFVDEKTKSYIQSEAGLRRLRQPAPIDGGIGSASISSTTGQLISDETPPSTGGSAAKQAHREADQKRVPTQLHFKIAKGRNDTNTCQYYK